jgi:hypothetical protein
MTDAQLNGVTRAVAEAFEFERQRLFGELTQFVARAETLAAQVALLDSRSQAAAEVAGHANATVASVQRAIGDTPAALTVDGWRLALRCTDGRELVADLPHPDTAAIALLVVERHLEQLRGDKGDKGDEGPPVVVDVDELATALRTDPEFVAAARGDKGDQGDRGDPGPPGAPCEPWVAGVCRQGVRRSHFLGRVYEAAADTSDEPGDSPQWRRIDTTGLRHIGPREPAERGDIYTKEGATFLYDGARSWLLSAKAFSTSDGERLINPLKQAVHACGDRITAADTRAATIADIARAANANATEALRWITARAEAIDQLLADGA